MAAFQYVAVNSKGATQTGVLDAESIRDVRQLLRDRGLIPLEVHSAQQKSSKFKKSFFAKPQLSIKELTLLTRQLATLLAAALPLEEVLAACSEQTEKARTKALILSVRSKVLEGHSLASSLKEFPQAFSPLYCSTVAAGEKSGHLDVVLQRLADFTEQQYQMRQKISHALIYPAIMIFVSFGIVGFLLEFVVPKMVSVYSNIGQTLPWMTSFLISISQHIKNEGIYVFFLLIFFFFGLKRLILKKEIFREKFHRFLLSLPVLGSAIKVASTARFARTFAILSASGVPILDAMRISSSLITSIPIKKAMDEATLRVREGANIHLALKQTRFFPPMSIHLIASGEGGGQLEPMLERAANNQDNDITRLIDTGLTLFEPAIILVMGAVVLFIVLAILLPIFQLDQFTG